MMKKMKTLDGEVKMDERVNAYVTINQKIVVAANYEAYKKHSYLLGKISGMIKNGVSIEEIKKVL